MKFNNITELLFDLFGEGKLIDNSYDYYHYECNKFHVDLLEKNGFWLVSIDLNSSFNKTSQSPIHFIWSEFEDISKRKLNRIKSAINFLLANEKKAGTFFFSLPGYDDLSEDVRRDFYHNY